MEADAFATSLCVMSPSQGTDFVNGLAACESLVIGKDGVLWKSKGWKSRPYKLLHLLKQS